MRKKVKIKHAEEFQRQHETSSLLLDDPGTAAAYAAQEAFSAGVSPSAVMYSTPDGAFTGEDLVASESVSEVVADEEPAIEPKVEKKAEHEKLDKAIKPASDKSEISTKNAAPVED